MRLTLSPYTRNGCKYKLVRTRLFGVQIDTLILLILLLLPLPAALLL
jgi:hypothetical protein